MKKYKIVSLLLIAFLFLPVIGIAKTSIKDKISLDWASSQLSIFEEVISRSKVAGIDTANLERIASEAKQVEADYTSAYTKNENTNKSIAQKEMIRLSHEFTDELLKIREEQDMKNTERAMLLLYKTIPNAEIALAELDSRGVNTAMQKIKLANIKSKVSTAESYYGSKNYKLAEKEIASAFEGYGSLISELKPILETHNLTMRD